MTTLAPIARPPSPLTSGRGALPARDFSTFEESPAMTCLSLREMTTPGFIMFAPPGRRITSPMGAKKPVALNVTEVWAKRISSQLHAMLAAGRKPFVDLNHEGTPAGYMLDIFWRYQSGICAVIDWFPAAEQAILRGEYTNFSPQWVIIDQELVGIGLNCGGLIHRSIETAYGAHFCQVKPVTKGKAMTSLAELFIEKMDRRGMELRAKGDELALIHAHDELRDQFPKLYSAYQLRENLVRELGFDLRIMNA